MRVCQIDKHVIGERIRQARERAGLSQAEVASGLGLHEKSGTSTVSRWESGERNFPVEQTAPLANLLGCSVGFLLDISEEEVSPERALHVIKSAVQEAREAEQLRDNLVQLSAAVRASGAAASLPPEIQAILDKYPDDPKASRVATWEKSWNMGPIKPHTERAELAAREIKKKRKKKGDE
jgi:transcriptional regulator with XRE-family HTH domain